MRFFLTFAPFVKASNQNHYAIIIPINMVQ